VTGKASDITGYKDSLMECVGRVTMGKLVNLILPGKPVKMLVMMGPDPARSISAGGQPNRD